MLAASSPRTIEDRECAFLAIVEKACREANTDGDTWYIEAAARPDAWWTFVRNIKWPLRAQGWKLHISATVDTAESVLRRALPILLSSTASFKFAATSRHLRRLNDSTADPSTVGKFLTVYPASDDEAVQLAAALHAATRGLNGPRIVTDRRLTPDSVVSYRYGGYERRLMQRPAGAIFPALETPQGDLIPDDRGTAFKVPEWTTDIFVSAGVAADLSAPRTMIAGRYLSLTRLRHNGRGSVEVVLDTMTLRSRVLKRALCTAEPGRDGLGPRDWLRHEATILQQLTATGLAPDLFEILDDAGDVVVVMEHIEGESLHQRLAECQARCTMPDDQLVLDWARQLARQLGQLHDRQLVFRDLKPANVIVTPGGQLRLVDFELVGTPGDAPLFGSGTTGYCSPESARGERVAVTDDVYSLGALLYAALTGAEPGVARDPLQVLRDRPLQLLNPHVGDRFARTIERCMAPEAERRYASMRDVEHALAQLDDFRVSGLAAPKPPAATEYEMHARADAAHLARRLGDAMCAASQPTPDNSGLRAPVSQHPRAYGFAARDVNVGTAGIVLALTELVTVFDDPQQRDTLHQAAHWLRKAPALGPTPLPGLYVGEAGISLALLRAGLALGDEQLISAANARGAWLASLPHTRLDLFSGTAGRLRFHLLIGHALGESLHLDAARRAGDVLLDRALLGDDGIARWPSDEASDQPCANYAHGAAGIADALLDLYETTGDERYRSVAFKAATWLGRLAQPVLADGTGVDWPSIDGGPGSGGTWCHGAAGTGIFFLHAARLGLNGAGEVAARAGRAVAFGTRWAGPSQCHGLAGSIELLLDLYQATGESAYLTNARELERAMRAFVTDDNRILTLHSGWRQMVSPDYMVGYGGVASCWLRLADPDNRPRYLGGPRP